MSPVDAALSAASSAALGLARLFLRTPLERAALDAAPAALRLADALKSHFATPQGLADKALFEKLADAAGAAMKPASPTPATMTWPAAPPDADADIAPADQHYSGAHGGSIYTGKNAVR